MKKKTTAIVTLLCSAMLLGSCAEGKEQTTTTTAQVQVMKETIGNTVETVPEEAEPESEVETDKEAASSETSQESAATPPDETTAESKMADNDAEQDSDTKTAVEEAVKRGIETSIALYDTDKDGNELIDEMYENFDLETLYYITTGSVGDKEQIISELTSGGTIDLSTMTQAAANSQSEDYSWHIGYSAPVTDERYKDMYNMMHGINDSGNEMLASMYENFPSFEKAKEDLNIEDVWCCSVESTNKPTEEQLAMFENASTAEMMNKIKEIYGIELTDDGYVLSTIDYFVFKRNGEWKLDMGYTSYYQATKMFTSGFMDELINSMQEGFSTNELTAETSTNDAA